MKTIFLFFLLLFSLYCNSQDTVIVKSVSKRNKAVVHYSIDKLKSSRDTLFLTRKHNFTYRESDIVKLKKWDLIFDEIADKSIFKVYFKDRLIEICSGNTEYYVGDYTFFYKGKIVLIKGQYDSYGQKVGTWKFYTKKGKLKSTLNYEVNHL